MEYEIRFSALAAPLHQQINNQFDLGLKGEDVGIEQKLSDGITLLSIHSMLNDSEVSRARKRLMKRLLKIVSNFKVQSVGMDEVAPEEADTEEVAPQEDGGVE